MKKALAFLLSLLLVLPILSFPSSAAESDKVPAPAVPKLRWALPTFIRIYTISGLEYTIDGGENWQEDEYFYNVRGGTTYEIRARVKAKDGLPCSAPSEPLVVTTGKLNHGLPPDSPVAQSRTDVSITLEAKDGCEYSIDGGTTWQDESVFQGLSPDTAYSFVLRIAETQDVYASSASSPTTVRTKKSASAAPAAPKLLDRSETTVTVC